MVRSNLSPKLLELETSNLVGGFVLRMSSRHTNNFPEIGHGLGHVTPTIFLAVRSAILATAWLLVNFFRIFLSKVRVRFYNKNILLIMVVYNVHVSLSIQ